MVERDAVVVVRDILTVLVECNRQKVGLERGCSTPLSQTTFAAGECSK